MTIHSRLLVLAGVLAFAISCDGPRSPTAPGVPTDPSKIISDGAHCANLSIACNKDFFFLPPMVADPSKDPNFEAGQFNATLAPNLTVEICQLQGSPVDAQGNSVATDCMPSPTPLVKKFAAGTVTLQNPPDGFYQVVWHVAESNLDASKFYRIKVLAEGASQPFGVADVDPVLSMKELRNARTGEIIPLNENSTLPIKFRIEHGGGSALCGDATVCNSTTITNSSTSGSQSLTVEGGDGSIAGAKFPDGWLPAGGPQSVLVTIAQIPVTGGGSTTDAAPCHQGLVLQQFKGCFSFTTTPTLDPINEKGDQFAVPVIVAVCYELYGKNPPDLREKFAELWASGPNEAPHPLDDASDAGLLGPDSHNCNTTPPVITSTSSNALVRFASARWQNLKSGLGKIFGIKTAYAIDLGLGGVATAFSHVSPVLSATIQTYTDASLNLGAGATTTSTVRIVGNNHHATHTQDIGIGGLPVTFTLAPGNGSLLPLNGTGAGSNEVTVTTNTNPIDGSAVSGGGFAPVNWTMPTPTIPGTYTYTLSANGPALGGPVTFTSVVTVAPPIAFSVLSGTWLNDNANTGEVARVDINSDGNAVTVHGFGACAGSTCDWGNAAADVSKWNTERKLTAVWNFGYEITTMTITYNPTSGKISIVDFNDYQPPDTRTDYTSTAETFTKQALPLSALIGNWYNDNNTTYDVSGLVIWFGTGNSVNVTPSGRCDGTTGNACAWDPTSADISQWNTSQTITFVVDRGFGTKSVTAQWVNGHLHLTTVTHFTDGSGRADYTTNEDLILLT